jgi:hypothetical protein
MADHLTFKGSQDREAASPIRRRAPLALPANMAGSARTNRNSPEFGNPYRVQHRRIRLYPATTADRAGMGPKAGGGTRRRDAAS